MKTCLFCGGMNKDSATTCLLCKRDLQTGNSQGGQDRPAVSLSRPQPESPYASLLLLLPTLVLFLFSAAVKNAAEQKLFFGVHLPRFAHPELAGNLMILSGLLFLGIMAWRMVRQFFVMKGFYLLATSEDVKESDLAVRMYARYQKTACGFYPLLWILPMGIFLGVMQLMYIGAYADYVVLFDNIRIRLPDVQDPIPYIFLAIIGLLAAAIQMVVSLSVVAAHRRYRRDCRRLARASAGTAEFSLLDARLFAKPLAAKIFLLVIPAVLAMLFYAVSFVGGNDLGAPEVVAGELWALIMLAAAVALVVIMAKNMILYRDARDGYEQAVRDRENRLAVSARQDRRADFHRYLDTVHGFRCFLWLIPILFFVGFAIYVLLSTVVWAITLPGGIEVVLPYYDAPGAYVLLAVLAALCLVILFVVFLNTTLSCRRCAVVARSRYQQDQIEAEARAKAEAEAAAARAAAEAAAAAEEEDSLWGDSFFSDEETEPENAATETTEEPAATDVAAETAAETAAEPAEADDLFAWMSVEADRPAAEEEKEDDLSLWMSGAEAEVTVDDRRLAALRALSAKAVRAPASTRVAATWSQLYEWFMAFAETKGYRPESASAQSLLAAMATSRIVYVRAADEASREFASVLARFFGSNATAGTVTDEWSSPQSLLCVDENHVWMDSECLRGMYYARKAPNSFCTLTLENGNAADAEAYLADLLPYAETPARTHSLCLVQEAQQDLPEGTEYRAAKGNRPGGVYMDLPANVWCLVLSSEETGVYGNTAGTETGSALTVTLRGTACEPAEGETVSDELSVAGFSRMLHGIMEEHFLPEEQWKKFDRVENFLSLRTGASFGNCMMRRMETFSSAYMAMEEDLNRVLDAMLEVVFLPLIAASDAALLRADESGMGIYEIVAQAFGPDTVPNSMRVLRAMGFEA